MINLSVKCSICGKEESDTEVIKEVSGIIEKYNLEADYYLHLLNVMSGKCMSSSEHSFLFDEVFLTQMEELVNKHKKNIEDMNELNISNEGIKKEVDELIIKTKEIQSKYNSNEDRINNLYNSNNDCVKEIEDATGLGKIDIWS